MAKMSLTRSVIFEKSMFAIYTHPKRVPQYLWDYFIKLINKSNVTEKAAIELYINIVILPLSQLKTYTILEPMMESIMIQSNINSTRWVFGIQSSERNLQVQTHMNNRSLIFIQSLTFQIWHDVSWNPELRNKTIE